jgi:hypothetical protein
MSKVLENVVGLDSFNLSMRCAIDKAMHGSDVEDAYFLEKLEKTAHTMGYDLVKQSD